MQHYPGTILTVKGWTFYAANNVQCDSDVIACMEVEDECGVVPTGAFCLVFF